MTSTTTEALDRTVFEALRLAVVAGGYLPDKDSFGGNLVAYTAAEDALRATLPDNQLIKVSGFQTGEVRKEKTYSQILVTRKGERNASIMFSPDTEYNTNIDAVETKATIVFTIVDPGVTGDTIELVVLDENGSQVLMVDYTNASNDSADVVATNIGAIITRLTSLGFTAVVATNTITVTVPAGLGITGNLYSGYGQNITTMAYGAVLAGGQSKANFSGGVNPVITYTKVSLADPEDVDYEIRLVTNSTYYERVISGIIRDTLPRRNYFPLRDSSKALTGEYGFMEFGGSVILDSFNWFERIYKYKFKDIILSQDVVLRDNIVPITTITPNIIAVGAGNEKFN